MTREVGRGREREREIWKRDITTLAKVGHRTREKKKERIRECRYSTREKERGREKKREVNDPMTRVVD